MTEYSLVKGEASNAFWVKCILHSFVSCICRLFGRIRLLQFQISYSCDSIQVKSSASKGKPLMV